MGLETSTPQGTMMVDPFISAVLEASLSQLSFTERFTWFWEVEPAFSAHKNYITIFKPR